MTDQYEPVSADDLGVGEEVEVTCYLHLEGPDLIAIRNGYMNMPVSDLVIRRKIKPPEPLRAGDTAKDVFGDTVTILAIDENEAWVKDVTGDRYSHELCELTRIQPKPSADGDWIEWGGGENPAPGKTVEYKMCWGSMSYIGRAESLRWDKQDWDTDIVAYRIVKDDTQ